MYTYRYADYLIFNEGKKQHQFFYKWNLDAHTHVYTFFLQFVFRHSSDDGRTDNVRSE